MTLKILVPPSGHGGSFIVGTNGRLRVVDLPKRCKGYANACCCPGCKERARLVKEPPASPVSQPWEAKAA